MNSDYENESHISNVIAVTIGVASWVILISGSIGWD